MSQAGSAPSAAAPEPFTSSLERMNHFQEPEARALIADLALPAGSRGLDVGCGVGLYALWLAEAVGPGGSVVGVEPTEERAAAARDLVGGRLADGRRLEFRAGDGTALDMETGSFDWLWCGDVLHHIADTERALAEFRRVVRPGGRIVVKESQVLSAMFLPGHPELERRIQLAEIERTREEGAGPVLPRAAADDAVLAPGGRARRRDGAQLSHRAPGAASRPGPGLHPEDGLRPQLGRAAAPPLERFRLGAALRPVRRGLAARVPRPRRLLLPLSDHGVLGAGARPACVRET